ncbi:hypothetical protein Q0590_24930 [Rhodocytophaga aerolata]|uniref:Uncharacterized protein n=1 Tax=Rhodocytophaga aerolata TaxID=455078 RepID=A0ABT8RFI7_9BACT|nr:hypothetical protein [Rhodocytophaga aerolata]
MEQAQRTAWKSLHEWVHLQLDRIEQKHIEPMEAFFPYLYDLQNTHTLYEKAKVQNFKLLENP